MPSKLLTEVAGYCWSNNFLDVFRNFFKDHGEEFEDAPPMLSGEHNLKYYNLFQVYLKLYETTLENYLKTLDVPIEEFYRDVRDAQNEADDPYLSTFIDCLLASADYDSFYKVMAREGQRVAKMKALLKSSPKKDAKDAPIVLSDVKAEIKGTSPAPRAADEKGASSVADDKKGDNDDSEAPSEKKSYK